MPPPFIYQVFFGLAEPPFNITPDSRFLFLSQRHREALGALVYGIDERKGFILLTGEIGAGKTTVCRALIQQLRAQDVKLAVILNPGLSEIELLKTINDEFQIPSFYDTKKGLVDALNTFLIAEMQTGRNVVLLIDEAQNLEPALLEQIRMLSNLETEDAKLIQIVLVGQPELRETLKLAQLEQLDQRIAVRFHLPPLSPEEMLAYIKHRLHVARAKVDVEFTEAAVRACYAATRGVPRKVNVVCDRALLACYAEGTYTVDEKLMGRAVSETFGDPEPAPGQGGSSSTRGIPAARADTAYQPYAPLPSRRPMLPRLARAAGGAALAAAALALAAYTGMKYADSRSPMAPERASATPTPAPGGKRGGKAGRGTAGTTFSLAQAGAAGDDATTAAATPTPAPKPATEAEWTALRLRQPHWRWDKNAPLVRVNNPRYNQRAAQFSVLRTWGISVDLSAAAAQGDDIMTQGNFTSYGDQRIAEVAAPGTFGEAIRWNVPLIVKTKARTPDLSAHVVLMQAAGEVVTVGDPVWGIKTFKTSDFTPHWDGATALFLDKNRLLDIRRGEKSERVRLLQRFLADFLKRKPSRVNSAAANPDGAAAKPPKSAARDQGLPLDSDGVFDTRSEQAIGQFQDYFNLPRTEKPDEATALLLNARMELDSPRLNPALD